MKSSKTRSEPRKYAIERSPLFRLSNKKKLAALLDVEVSEIRDLVKSGLDQQYRFFVDKKTRRFITEPIDALAKIHRQLLKLLARIEPPDYVHSAIKKRSYKTNAYTHINGGGVIKVDIKKFFPSIRFDCIHAFFSESMKCSPDIATILARLCVVKSEKHGIHLPTGSCISPVLSFLANKPMFDEIKKISDEHGCIFTLYVDDITISGIAADAKLLSLVASEIFKRGYKYHKTNVTNGDCALVTGLVVKRGRLYLPHERIVKIRDLAMLLNFSTGAKERILASLVGRLSEAEQIEPRYKMLRLHVIKQHKSTWTKIVLQRTRKSRVFRNRTKLR